MGDRSKVPSERSAGFYHEVNNYNHRYDNHPGASGSGLGATEYGKYIGGRGRLSLILRLGRLWLLAVGMA
jgi:hypothetical protein